MNRKKSSDKESAMVGFNYQPGSERTYSMRNCDHGERWTGSYRNGNFIPDTRFHYIDSSLEEQVKAITGAIESELFIGYDVEIITAE